jgi:hypothetical protein
MIKKTILFIFVDCKTIEVYSPAGDGLTARAKGIQRHCRDKFQFTIGGTDQPVEEVWAGSREDAQKIIMSYRFRIRVK